MGASIPEQLLEAKPGDLTLLISSSERKATLGIFDKLILLESENPSLILEEVVSLEPPEKYNGDVYIPNVDFRQTAVLECLGKYKVYRGASVIRAAVDATPFLKPYAAMMGCCETDEEVQRLEKTHPLLLQESDQPRTPTSEVQHPEKIYPLLSGEIV